VDINRAWESDRETMKASATDEYSESLDQRKQAKLRRLQNPSQRNAVSFIYDFTYHFST